jgi:hypothetical protein
MSHGLWALSWIFGGCYLALLIYLLRATRR